MQIEIVCQNCNKTFFKKKRSVKRVNNRHFCNRNCFNEFRQKQNISKCFYCDKSFKATPHRRKRAKYLFCSNVCHAAWMKNQSPLSGKTVICNFCKKSFYKIPSHITNCNFCSRRCHQLWNSQQAIQRREELSINKQKYLHRLKSLRSSVLYELWRDAVYKKDYYKCQVCNVHKSLVAHHVKNFKDFPTLRFAIDNGITLCKKCHNRIHYSKLLKG